MTAFAENHLSTHEVVNQPQALVDYNLFEADAALAAGVARAAPWALADLTRFGALAGSADYLELGALANRHPPEFDTHDRYGRRVDLVRFHPAYHELMRVAVAEGIAASPWDQPRPGAHVARAAKFYMQSQVEAGHGCPITMTFAATPALRREPALAAQWLPRLHSREYDPANAPAQGKRGATMGMAMTEKQGGSDVRANTTRAVARADGSYEITGHKYFVSAPMCDAFLMLAQTPAGLTCFLSPRWLPDGTKNPIEFVRLKRKMGNVSNASAETEWRGATGWRVGPEGRGVATIIEMVAMTRFDCMIGSSAGMRRAVTEAIDHCGQRRAFGAKLIDQPIMRAVLADLALEAEASLALTLRLAGAFDANEGALVRLGTALGKYWICKRAPQLAFEAMECVGGSGVMEDGPMPRLYREGPVNAIWEGSGNVQCLDVMRAIEKTPETLEAYFAEVGDAKGTSAALDAHVDALKADLRACNDFEARARDFCDRLALGLQGAAMVRAAPGALADAFCRARLESRGAHHYGVLPAGVDEAAIVRRAAAR
ncbi:MAG: acyl-CoA dehydrogenase family protein [Pseudomonadota bacterium]|nr:acyl-CoA dehydrogenase family protein [Pseudomonadota bacterium]